MNNYQKVKDKDTEIVEDRVIKVRPLATSPENDF